MPAAIQIDEKMLARMARLQCTYEEMAAELDCSKSHLFTTYKDFIAREKEKGKSQLRAYQWKLMEHWKSIAMAQFLGKEYLGQGKENTNMIDVTPIEQLNANLENLQKKDGTTQDSPEEQSSESHSLCQ